MITCNSLFSELSIGILNDWHAVCSCNRAVHTENVVSSTDLRILFEILLLSEPIGLLTPLIKLQSSWKNLLQVLSIIMA